MILFANRFTIIFGLFGAIISFILSFYTTVKNGFDVLDFDFYLSILNCGENSLFTFVICSFVAYPLVTIIEKRLLKIELKKTLEQKKQESEEKKKK